MIEYILVVVVLAVVILLIFGSGSSQSRGPRILKDHSSDYHGVYSHDSKSPDSDVYFPVLKDFSSIMPMNKREERKKTETHQPRR